MKRSSGAVITDLCGKLVWVLIGFQASVVSAAEIAYFRLTDFSGHLQTTNAYSSYLIQSTDTETKITEPTSRREFGLATESYIYHPNMLKLNISGSVLMDTRSYTEERTSFFTQTEIEADSIDFTWNFDSSFSFLEKKPFPLTLFYNRHNPLSGSGLAETFSTENTSYGFRLGLRRPFSPVSINISASRKTTQGGSTLQLVDKSTDALRVRATHRFSKGASLNFNYNLTSQNSLSGNPALPILATSYLDQRLNLDSRWTFGNRKQYRWTQNAGLNTRDAPDRLDTRYSTHFVWTHSPSLQSDYQYKFNSADVPGSLADSLSHYGRAALRYTQSERLNGGFSVHAAHSEEALDSIGRNYGFFADVKYKQPVSFLHGKLILGGGVGYDRFDRESATNQIDVIDESHTLTGTTPVILLQDFVIESSIAVTNGITATDCSAPGSQIFQEDVDYRLIVIGSQTRLERLIAGNILDGQCVVINYAFDPGGTFTYSALGTNFNANLTLARYYNLYLRYGDRNQSLESGIPTTQLNSTRRIELGARADVPLPWWGLLAGGDTEFINQQEDISPFDSLSFLVYLQLPLPYSSTFRVSTEWVQRNNHNSPEDANLTRFSASLGSSPWHHLNLFATADHEIDSGGLFETSRSKAKLVANWQLRKLRINAEVAYNKETQGDAERDGLSAFLTIGRLLW